MRCWGRNEANRKATWALIDAEHISVIAFGVGVVSLAVAIVAVLLQRTRNVPPMRRLYLMARLACLAVWSVFPPRWAVASVSAGLLAFIGSWLVGVAITYLIVCAIPPTVPHPTEAYEGVGDALIALYELGIGASLSLFIAMPVGFIVGERVASRWS